MWRSPFECAREEGAVSGMTGQVSKEKKKKFDTNKNKIMKGEEIEEITNSNATCKPWSMLR